MAGFWKNYEICKKWRELHKAALQEIDYENRLNYPELYSNNPIPTSSVDFSYGQSKQYGAGVTTETQNRLDNQVAEDYNNYYYYEDNQNETEDYSFEVNQEWMDFLEISMRHKQELREQREKEGKTLGQEKKNKSSGKSKKSSNKDVKQFVPEPDCRTASKLRSEQMKLLYGDAANKIQGMETAVQLSFDMKCDSLDVTFWPIVPIREY
ncbi:gem-associated protein 8 isoform X2 [Nilaparvata lugens]|nr:gem-associated protein 8 isoform X2 [Nilaparvata lugens]XP_022198157.2 gem-associated protein 8 isoform X2 [Nilaparvata lugens]